MLLLQTCLAWNCGAILRLQVGGAEDIAALSHLLLTTDSSTLTMIDVQDGIVIDSLLLRRSNHPDSTVSLHNVIFYSEVSAFTSTRD